MRTPLWEQAKIALGRGKPDEAAALIDRAVEQWPQYTGSSSRMKVRGAGPSSVRYACSPSYLPWSMRAPPEPHRNDSTIFSSSSSTSSSLKLLTIARAITFARRAAGRSPHADVTRRGRMYSSPVLRSARSTPSSPSSSPMNVSNDVTQLIE